MEYRYEDNIIYKEELKLYDVFNNKFLIDIEASEQSKYIDVFKNIPNLELQIHLIKNLNEIDEIQITHFKDSLKYTIEEDILICILNNIEIISRDEENIKYDYNKGSGELEEYLNKKGFFNPLYLESYFVNDKFEIDLLNEKGLLKDEYTEGVLYKGKLNEDLYYEIKEKEDDLDIPLELLNKRKSETQFKGKIAKNFMIALAIGSSSIVFANDDLPLNPVDLSGESYIQKVEPANNNIMLKITNEINSLMEGEDIKEVKDFNKIFIKGGKKITDNIIKKHKQSLEKVDRALSVVPKEIKKNNPILSEEEIEEQFWDFKKEIKTDLLKGRGVASVENHVLKFQAKVNVLSKKKVQEEVVLKAISLKNFALDNTSISGGAVLENHEQLKGNVQLNYKDYSVKGEYIADFNNNFDEKVFSVNWNIDF